MVKVENSMLRQGMGGRVGDIVVRQIREGVISV
jgi:hypothetical protein